MDKPTHVKVHCLDEYYSLIFACTQEQTEILKDFYLALKIATRDEACCCECPSCPRCFPEDCGITTSLACVTCCNEGGCNCGIKAPNCGTFLGPTDYDENFNTEVLPNDCVWRRVDDEYAEAEMCNTFYCDDERTVLCNTHEITYDEPCTDIGQLAYNKLTCQGDDEDYGEYDEEYEDGDEEDYADEEGEEERPCCTLPSYTQCLACDTTGMCTCWEHDEVEESKYHQFNNCEVGAQIILVYYNVLFFLLFFFPSLVLDSESSHVRCFVVATARPTGDNELNSFQYFLCFIKCTKEKGLVDHRCDLLWYPTDKNGNAIEGSKYDHIEDSCDPQRILCEIKKDSIFETGDFHFREESYENFFEKHRKYIQQNPACGGSEIFTEFHDSGKYKEKINLLKHDGRILILGSTYAKVCPAGVPETSGNELRLTLKFYAIVTGFSFDHRSQEWMVTTRFTDKKLDKRSNCQLFTYNIGVGKNEVKNYLASKNKVGDDRDRRGKKSEEGDAKDLSDEYGYLLANDTVYVKLDNDMIDSMSRNKKLTEELVRVRIPEDLNTKIFNDQNKQKGVKLDYRFLYYEAKVFSIIFKQEGNQIQVGLQGRLKKDDQEKFQTTEAPISDLSRIYYKDPSGMDVIPIALPKMNDNFEPDQVRDVTFFYKLANGEKQQIGRKLEPPPNGKYVKGPSSIVWTPVQQGSKWPKELNPTEITSTSPSDGHVDVILFAEVSLVNKQQMNKTKVVSSDVKVKLTSGSRETTDWTNQLKIGRTYEHENPYKSSVTLMIIKDKDRKVDNVAFEKSKKKILLLGSLTHGHENGQQSASQRDYDQATVITTSTERSVKGKKAWKPKVLSQDTLVRVTIDDSISTNDSDTTVKDDYQFTFVATVLLLEFFKNKNSPFSMTLAYGNPPLPIHINGNDKVNVENSGKPESKFEVGFIHKDTPKVNANGKKWFVNDQRVTYFPEFGQQQAGKLLGITFPEGGGGKQNERTRKRTVFNIELDQGAVQPEKVYLDKIKPRPDLIKEAFNDKIVFAYSEKNYQFNNKYLMITENESKLMQEQKNENWISLPQSIYGAAVCFIIVSSENYIELTQSLEALVNISVLSPKEADKKRAIEKSLKGIWKDFFVRSFLLLSEILLTFLMQWILIYKVYEETPGPRALEWEINPMAISDNNEAIFVQEEESGFCTTASTLQIGAMAVLTLWTLDSLKDIWTEIRCYISKVLMHENIETGEYKLRRVEQRNFMLNFIFMIVIACETIITLLVFVFGANYVLMLDNAADIVGGVLATTFITEIDNKVYEITFMEDEDDANVETSRFRVTDYDFWNTLVCKQNNPDSVDEDSEEDSTKDIVVYFLSMCQWPGLVCLVVSIVMGMKVRYC